MNKINLIIIGCFILFLLVALCIKDRISKIDVDFLPEQNKITAEQNIEKKVYDFSDISMIKVYKIWDETSLGTSIHYEAYIELDKRGYFDKKRAEEKIKAQEVVNKYIK